MASSLVGRQREASPRPRHLRKSRVQSCVIRDQWKDKAWGSAGEPLLERSELEDRGGKGHGLRTLICVCEWGGGVAKYSGDEAEDLPSKC